MIKELFASWAGEPCLQQQQLTANGSNRMYFRLKGASQQCVAAVNADVRENEAFFYFASQLRQAGVRVPEVFAVSSDRTVYLQEDLGNTTLLQYLATKRSSGDDVTDEETSLYQQALTDLVTMQCRGRHFDFSHAYPRADFDRQSLQWDFNYFKYCFLKPMNIRFDEQALETDFGRFIDYLLEGECDSFVYRDFQTRNIMISAKQLAYIDFQGARRGAPQYDAASLLSVPSAVSRPSNAPRCSISTPNNTGCNATRSCPPRPTAANSSNATMPTSLPESCKHSGPMASAALLRRNPSLPKAFHPPSQTFAACLPKAPSKCRCPNWDGCGSNLSATKSWSSVTRG